MNKLYVFIITEVCYATIIGVVGEYSIIKYPIAQTFNYDDEFMGTPQLIIGIIDAVQLTGIVLSSLFLIFVSLKPNEAYFKLSVFNVLFAIVLCFAPYVESSFWQATIVMGSLFLHNLTFSRIVYSQLIFNSYFDIRTEKVFYTIWFAISYSGELFSILLCD